MLTRRTLCSLAVTTALTGALITATPGVSAVTVTVDRDICTTVLTVDDYRHLLQVQSDHLNELFNQLKLAVPAVSTDLDGVYHDALVTFRSGEAVAGEIPAAADPARQDRISAAMDTAGFQPGEHVGIVMGAAFARAYTEKNDAELSAPLLVAGEMPAETITRTQAAARLAELEGGAGDHGMGLGAPAPAEGASPKLLGLYVAANARVENPDFSVALKRSLQSCVTGTGGDFPLAEPLKSDPAKVPDPAVAEARSLRNLSSSSS